MSSYETLYGRLCRSLICWEEISDRALSGPEISEQTIEKIQVIKARMKTTQDRDRKAMPTSDDETLSLRYVTMFG